MRRLVFGSDTVNRPITIWSLTYISCCIKSRLYVGICKINQIRLQVFELTLIHEFKKGPSQYVLHIFWTEHSGEIGSKMVSLFWAAKVRDGLNGLGLVETYKFKWQNSFLTKFAQIHFWPNLPKFTHFNQT